MLLLCVMGDVPFVERNADACARQGGDAGRAGRRVTESSACHTTTAVTGRANAALPGPTCQNLSPQVGAFDRRTGDRRYPLCGHH